MATAAVPTSITIPTPASASGHSLAPTVLLLACGKHDRGNLFPKTKRQFESLKAPLTALLGSLDTEHCLVFHDGSKQAEATAALLELPPECNQGERTFLYSPATSDPDDYEMDKAVDLILKADLKDVLFFILDSVYTLRFASYYQRRLLGQSTDEPRIGPGCAVVFKADGTMHVLTPFD